MYIIGKGVIGEELITSFKKKNLLQGVKWVQGFAEYTDKISDNSSFPNALSTEKLIRVNAKKTYHTNMYKYKDDYRIRTFDINKNRTGTGFDHINTDGTIFLPEGTVYIRVMSIWRQNVDGLYIKEVRTDGNNGKVENLIKDIYSNSSVANATKTYDSVNKIWTLTPSNASDTGIVIDTLNNKIKLNETYTVGYKLKIDSSSSTTGVCNKRIMVCEYRTFSVKYGVSGSVTSDGNNWIDIRITINNTKLDGGVRILFGTNGYKGGSYYIKEPFLIQGDYTNKKLPDSLFK